MTIIVLAIAALGFLWSCGIQTIKERRAGESHATIGNIVFYFLFGVFMCAGLCALAFWSYSEGKKLEAIPAPVEIVSIYDAAGNVIEEFEDVSVEGYREGYIRFSQNGQTHTFRGLPYHITAVEPEPENSDTT